MMLVVLPVRYKAWRFGETPLVPLQQLLSLSIRNESGYFPPLPKNRSIVKKRLTSLTVYLMLREQGVKQKLR